MLSDYSLTSIIGAISQIDTFHSRTLVAINGHVPPGEFEAARKQCEMVRACTKSIVTHLESEVREQKSHETSKEAMMREGKVFRFWSWLGQYESTHIGYTHSGSSLSNCRLGKPKWSRPCMTSSRSS